MIGVADILITSDATLQSALERLDVTGLSVLLLVDEEGRFRQTVTDGDLRRLLLRNASLSDSLCLLPHAASVAVRGDPGEASILTLMDETRVSQVPVLDDFERPVGLYLRNLLNTRVQLSIPHMGEREMDFVKQAFASNWIAPLGPNVDAFEAELADHVGVGFAAALSSGTAALHLALVLLGIKSGDWVICSSFTFVASANPIIYQGAVPIFVDSEPATWNMCPRSLEAAIDTCIKTGNKPKAIVVAHLYGQSANMAEIMDIANSYSIPVVEDAAESLGSFCQGRHSGTIGKLGVYSFNGNKIITTSGGGMLVSDDEELIDRARFLSTQARDPVAHYEHSVTGYNYRMSNVLAGIGLGQLLVLEKRVAARRKVFERYKAELADVPGFNWMPEREGDFSNRWLSAFNLTKDTSVKSNELISALASENIEARYVWKPMHLQPLFKGALYFHADEKSYCDMLFETGVCLPSASNMSEAQQARVVDKIRSVMLRKGDVTK